MSLNTKAALITVLIVAAATVLILLERLYPITTLGLISGAAVFIVFFAVRANIS